MSKIETALKIALIAHRNKVESIIRLPYSIAACRTVLSMTIRDFINSVVLIKL